VNNGLFHCRGHFFVTFFGQAKKVKKTNCKQKAFVKEGIASCLICPHPGPLLAEREEDRSNRMRLEETVFSSRGANCSHSFDVSGASKTKKGCLFRQPLTIVKPHPQPTPNQRGVRARLHARFINNPATYA
jgi:hypothetical protein